MACTNSLSESKLLYLLYLEFMVAFLNVFWNTGLLLSVTAAFCSGHKQETAS